MSLAKRRVRWAGVGVSCLVSVGLGLALVFRVVTPETLSRVHTPELLAMMGLLVMPGLAAWAIHTERRIRLKKLRQAEALAAAAAPLAELKPSAPLPSPWLSARPPAASPAQASPHRREPQRPTPGRHAETPAAAATTPSAPSRQTPPAVSAPSVPPSVRGSRGRRTVRPTLHTGSER